MRVLAFPVLLVIGVAVHAQPNFNSGSTGSDGALDFSSVPSGTTVVFDPTTYNPPLNPSRNNIFNFTTINIPVGVTVRLSGRIFSGPVYWLASGGVTINGTLDLSGENGMGGGQVAADRLIAYPGAGGYAGGLGGRWSGSVVLPATAGQGPAGGAAGTANTTTNSGHGGGFTGNNFLVPLIGGSGGGGAMNNDANNFGESGGGGGGAILIASSAGITCNGHINAYGGRTDGQGVSGGGAGGAIHLIAPTITGACNVWTYGGSGAVSSGANGYARLETSNYGGQFGFLGGGPSITATPILYLPTITGGFIKAISVNGVSLPATTTGSYTTPDVVINTTSPVPVVIQASNIPPGTVVTLQIQSDQGPDMTIQCPGLTGTLVSSTTSANVTFPPGFSRGYIIATW